MKKRFATTQKEGKQRKQGKHPKQIYSKVLKKNKITIFFNLYFLFPLFPLCWLEALFVSSVSLFPLTIRKKYGKI